MFHVKHELVVTHQIGCLNRLIHFILAIYLKARYERESRLSTDDPPFSWTNELKIPNHLFHVKHRGFAESALGLPYLFRVE